MTDVSVMDFMSCTTAPCRSFRTLSEESKKVMRAWGPKEQDQLLREVDHFHTYLERESIGKTLVNLVEVHAEFVWGCGEMPHTIVVQTLLLASSNAVHPQLLACTGRNTHHTIIIIDHLNERRLSRPVRPPHHGYLFGSCNSS